MARVRIELPERFVFATELPVCIQHINYANHLDNVALLALVAEARVRFLKSMGWSELDVAGVGLIVADVLVQYRSEAFHGEVLRAELVADEFTEYGCDLFWCLTAVGEGREVARGKHGIVFFNYQERQKAPVPAEFIRLAANAVLS